MNLSNIPTNELLQQAYLGEDPLTTTDMERELRIRLERTLDNGGALIDIVDDTGYTTSEAEEVLSIVAKNDYFGGADTLSTLFTLLHDHRITQADELKAVLEFHAKFRSLANDAGDVFERIHNLTNLILED